ncbi:MAG: hypothetical protein KDI79_04910 [Anaerolineae bacterium]|nr:hypothetical protein [Anaerolineae bacterium]
MITAKAKIRVDQSHVTTVPILIPSLNEVRELANTLHEKGMPWQGEAFGWQAEYNPEQSDQPLDSRMTFTPADFCIGESGIWFFSMMWENGKDAAPVEFLDDNNIEDMLRET